VAEVCKTVEMKSLNTQLNYEARNRNRKTAQYVEQQNASMNDFKERKITSVQKTPCASHFVIHTKGPTGYF